MFLASATLPASAYADEPSPRADEPSPKPDEPSPKEDDPAPAPGPGAPESVVPAKANQRTESLEPKVAEAAPTGRITFDIDPIADSAMIGVSLGFAGTLELINSTGEIRPQQVPPNFDRSKLFWLDRGAITQKVDPKAGGYSTIGLGAAVAFAFIDPILSGVREHSLQTGLADAFMYSETLAFTVALTNMTKMAVRRPRPIAYIEAERTPNAENTSTDSALSFFSGHAAVVGAVSATATYLAFARSPHTARPWVTLLVGVGLTSFVSIERVRAGRHFPTDVIAGSIAGAGIGIVVPHLHRTQDIKQRRIWVGFTPMNEQRGEHGGLLNLSGFF
ncbi:MAG: phosphatase PAP2 family protein [Polyangiaceae bacterium]